MTGPHDASAHPPDSLEAKLSDLQHRIAGVVLSGGDEYQQSLQPFARNPLNSTSGGVPAAVVKPRNIRDVAAAIKFARGNSMGVAVKGGGHGIRNDWLAPYVLLLDMSLMRGVYVDANEKVAVAEGGCLLEDIDSATSMYQLAAPLGVAAITGMGLVLNGGMGIMGRKFGLTCDSVLSFVLVTSDGEVVDVSANSHPELLWAMKGVGSAFGVVTHIKFRLHDVSAFYGGSLAWVDDPQHETYHAIAAFMKEAATTNEDFAMHILRMTHPVKGPMIISLVGYYGDDPAEVKAAYVAPLRVLGPVQDSVGKCDHYEMQRTLTPLFRATPPEARALGYWAHLMFTADQVNNEVLQKFCHWKDKLPAGAGVCAWATEIWGGISKSSSGPVGVSDADLVLALYLQWGDPSVSQQMVEFAKAFKADMAAYCGTGQYINYDSSSDADYKLAARVGGEANLQRIRQLKLKWDPDNVFKHHPFDGLVP